MNKYNVKILDEAKNDIKERTHMPCSFLMEKFL